MKKSLTTLAVAALVASAALTPQVSGAAEEGLTFSEAQNLGLTMGLRPDLSDESIYFVMPDRYANGSTDNDNGAGESSGGLNKSSIGYFHGGDLIGLRENLQRIDDMGFTALWITPVMLQRAVQGSSAAYHGYWGLDFTTVDPHFGSEQDFQDLVDAAHERGMKVYLDIVVNHTADIISYPSNQGYGFSSLSSKPYKDAAGNVVNLAEVAGLDMCTATGQTGCFPIMNIGSFPKTPEANDSDRKWPAFLQDVTNYHNRGDVGDWNDPNHSIYGDFFGLDDLMTEKPEVVQGLADVWADWIIDYGVDGFRIDTAKHVDKKFFSKWVPLVYDKALEAGKNLPAMFGEVAVGDPSALAEYIRERRLPSVLDFPMSDSVLSFSAGGTAVDFENMVKWDYLYNDGFTGTGVQNDMYSLVTFIGNHDQGRAAGIIENQTYLLSSAQLAQRVGLGYSILMTMRGAPTVYYGDEVGMKGNGGDKEARQDMFPTQVPQWRTQERAGSAPIGTGSSLTITSHPIMNQIKLLGALREAHPALRNGSMVMRKAAVALPAEHGKACKKESQSRYSAKDRWEITCIKFSKKRQVWQADNPRQVISWSRFDIPNKREYVVLANSSNGKRVATVTSSSPNTKFRGILGTTLIRSTDAAGKFSVTVPPRSVVVMRADGRVKELLEAPAVTTSYAKTGVSGEPEITAAVADKSVPVVVTFVYRNSTVDEWQVMGTVDDGKNRMVVPSRILAADSSIQVTAIVRTVDGQTSYSAPVAVTA